jgi:hypothetical protein
LPPLQHRTKGEFRMDMRDLAGIHATLLQLSTKQGAQVELSVSNCSSAN